MAKVDVSRIYGRIKFVTYAADYTAHEMAVGGQLRVKRVEQHALSPGLWQIVAENETADYRIQLLPQGGAQFTFTWA